MKLMVIIMSDDILIPLPLHYRVIEKELLEEILLELKNSDNKILIGKIKLVLK